MLGYIYYIINAQNGKRYVGQTFNFERRKSQHLNELRKKTHHSHKLQNAYNKYGEDNFIWEVDEVEIDNEEDLSLAEMAMIEHYNSYQDGYNETLGGEGGRRKFDLQLITAFAYILAHYSGVQRKIARYYNCDHNYFVILAKNPLFLKIQPDMNLVNKIIKDVGLTDDNLNENYEPHNDRKLNQNDCFEILSVISTETGYDKTLCQVFDINSKAIWRLKNNIIYQEYMSKFNKLSDEQKQKIKEEAFKKYDLEGLRAQRQRRGVANSLTQEQVDYILDNKDLKTRVQISKELNISADRVGSVILGKSYKDLVKNYYNARG